MLAVPVLQRKIEQCLHGIVGIDQLAAEVGHVGRRPLLEPLGAKPAEHGDQRFAVMRRVAHG